MNARILMLGLGIAVGYVFGTRAGREHYDAMKAKVSGVWENPRVAKARREVVDYAKEQAPVIRERAENLAKAAPGFVADTARDVAENVSTTAKNVAEKVGDVASDVRDRVGDVASDVREQASKVTADARERAAKVTADARDNAAKVAADLRERGENVVDDAVRAAGEKREEVLHDLGDDDEIPPSTRPTSGV
jgi:gas vesicle protein